MKRNDRMDQRLNVCEEGLRSHVRASGLQDMWVMKKEAH